MLNAPSTFCVPLVDMKTAVLMNLPASLAVV